MNRTTAAALCCAISLSAVPAHGQSTDAAGTTVYDGAFFARSQPSSAYDMVLLLPGFRLQEGDSEVRGYSGSAGNVLMQTLILGTVQIAVSLTANATFIVTAGAVSAFLTRRPVWAKVQRWLMGTVLGLLAVRLATDSSR